MTGFPLTNGNKLKSLACARQMKTVVVIVTFACYFTIRISNNQTKKRDHPKSDLRHAFNDASEKLLKMALTENPRVPTVVTARLGENLNAS